MRQTIDKLLRRSLVLACCWMLAVAAHAQADLAINEAFEKYGNQKGCKMVTLYDGHLKGYPMKVYKSLRYHRYAEEIRALVQKDRQKARKIKEIVVDGRVTSGYYTLPPKAEGVNRYVLFRSDEYGDGTLIYIEGELSPSDIMKITTR